MILHLSNAWLCVLAWVVQLWVYPTFGRLPSEKFFSQHPRYRIGIVFLTLPFMLIQSVQHTQNLLNNANLIHSIQWVAVLVTFVITFLFAVPIHLKMRTQGNQLPLIKSLLRYNLMRSSAWTVILVLDFIKFQ